MGYRVGSRLGEQMHLLSRIGRFQSTSQLRTNEMVTVSQVSNLTFDPFSDP